MKITMDEWKDYYSVQRSGEINMMFHPLIEKFLPDGNWKSAHDWFELKGNDTDLILREES